MTEKRLICLLGTSPASRGGIGTVVSQFLDSISFKKYKFEHIVTHADVSHFKKTIIAIKAFVAFKKGLREGRYEAVHIHSAFGASFFRSIPFIRESNHYGIPVINHIHSDSWEAFYGEASKIKKKKIAKVYRKCTKLIVLSDEWKEQLSTIVPSEQITVLENCTPIFDEKFHPSFESKQVVFMSRMEQIKGCDILPDIVEETIATDPAISFVFCGDGSFKEDVKREIANRGLIESVVFRGWLSGDSKIACLKSSSVFLLPSYGEGMPMCILEAMGVGLPVVASRVGGVPQLVKNGHSGILCDCSEPSQFAQAIVSILGERRYFEELSLGAKIEAKKRSTESYSAALEALYDEILCPCFHGR